MPSKKSTVTVVKITAEDNVVFLRSHSTNSNKRVAVNQGVSVGKPGVVEISSLMLNCQKDPVLISTVKV